jgi:hypothetical protein
VLVFGARTTTLAGKWLLLMVGWSHLLAVLRRAYHRFCSSANLTTGQQQQQEQQQQQSLTDIESRVTFVPIRLSKTTSRTFFFSIEDGRLSTCQEKQPLGQEESLVAADAADAARAAGAGRPYPNERRREQRFFHSSSSSRRRPTLQGSSASQFPSTRLSPSRHGGRHLEHCSANEDQCCCSRRRLRSTL